MAKAVLTYNQQPIDSKSWKRLDLTGSLKDKWDTITKARDALEKEIVSKLREVHKVTPQHEVIMSYRFGPSYVIADKQEGKSGSRVTKL